MKNILRKHKKNLVQHENSINFKPIQENNIFTQQPDLWDYALPTAIDATRADHIFAEGNYMAALLCTNFPYQVQGGWLEEIINCGEGIEISLNHQPLNTNKVSRDIQSQRGFTLHKIRTGGENQLDSEMQQNSLHHSQIIKQALAAGDELWHMSLLVRITAKTLVELTNKLNKVANVLIAKDILYERLDCRQLEGIVSSLPLGYFHPSFKLMGERNILTSGLAGSFPFTSYELSDIEGIFCGVNKHNGSGVILDIFNTSKYSNANMILLGASGSGKTFATQLIANRLNLQKIPIMMICPLKGHEYQRLCENVGGLFLSFAPGSSHTINIFDLNPNKTKDSILLDKLQRLQVFFSLLFPDINNEEKQLLDQLMLELYGAKGITPNNESIYETPLHQEQENNFSLKPKLKTMPTMSNFYAALGSDPRIAHLQILLKTFVDGSLSFFNGQTNVDLSNDYIVADISKLQKDIIPLAMFTVLDCFWEKIKANPMHKKALILDEAWYLMGAGGNKLTAEYVLEISKTIRGYSGSSILATQDIEDFMALENGKYGVGILNNACLKFILRLEENGAKALNNVLNLAEAERDGILNAKRGEALLYAGSNHISISFKASQLEQKLITTDRKEMIAYWGDECA